MKRFFILLFGLIGGFAFGFFVYGKAHVWVNKAYVYLEQKKTEFFENKYQGESLVAENDGLYEVSEPDESVDVVEFEETDDSIPTVSEPETDVISGTDDTAGEVKSVEPQKISAEPKKVVMQDTTHGKKGIAATINGNPITVDEIRFTYDVNPQIKEKLSFEEFYEKAVRVYVEGKILYDAAVASNILETEEFKKQLSLLQQDIARKVFVEKTLEKSINEDTVRKLYDDYRKNFKPQKEVRAKHILVESENLANDVIIKLGAGENFEKLAEQYSKEPAELGYFTKDMMIPEFGDAAFALNLGEYSKKPVKTEYGYHIIKVEDIRDSKPAEYEEASVQLRQMMTEKVIESLYSGVKKDADIVVYGYDGKEIPLDEKASAK